MEMLEFLGGKYKSGEQILPGVIQTYRATETATGRSVFVHRVSSTDDIGQQLVLYRLLAAALVRSPAVRSMVLDVRDEASDWYVITDTAPQCLLLREWLQFELGHPAKASDGKKEEVARPFKVASPSAPVPQPMQETTPFVPPSAKQPEEPGEFTRLFSGNIPTSPKPSRTERSPNPDLLRNPDRPVRSGSVQRPNTPMPFVPPAAPQKAEPGEFTRLFSKPGAGESVQNPRPPLETPKISTGYQDLFQSPSEPMVPTPPVVQQPGEYTRIFGRGDAPLPVGNSQVSGGDAPVNYDDPLFVPGPEKVSTFKSQATAGPSEYTRVISSVPVKTPPLPVQTPKVEPSPAADVATKAAVRANAKNTKLIIFFAVLGLVALILILLLGFALRK